MLLYGCHFLIIFHFMLQGFVLSFKFHMYLDSSVSFLFVFLLKKPQMLTKTTETKISSVSSLHSSATFVVNY